MTDALHFIYLELGRLKARIGEEDMCTNTIERLAYSLKYMHQLEEKPKRFHEEIQGMLFKAGELAEMTQEQRRQYEIAMTTKLDIIAQQDYAREMGREQGLKEGMEKGLESAQAAFAKKLAEKGFSEKEIAELTKI